MKQKKAHQLSGVMHCPIPTKEERPKITSCSLKAGKMIVKAEAFEIRHRTCNCSLIGLCSPKWSSGYSRLVWTFFAIPYHQIVGFLDNKNAQNYRARQKDASFQMAALKTLTFMGGILLGWGPTGGENQVASSLALSKKSHRPFGFSTEYYYEIICVTHVNRCYMGLQKFNIRI